MKERIKKLCALKGISLNQLETELKFGKGYLSKLNEKNANTKKLMEIANYFGVSVEYLLGTEDIEWNPHTQEIIRKSRYDFVPIAKDISRISGYYQDTKAEELAEFLHKNPEYSVLFDASTKVKPEDIAKALKAIGIFIDEE